MMAGAVMLMLAQAALPPVADSASDKRFIVAAEAGDLATMRTLVVDPVTWSDGEATPSESFFNYVSRCKYTGYGNIVSWNCPSRQNGGAEVVVVVGDVAVDGRHVRLSGLSFLPTLSVPSGTQN